MNVHFPPFTFKATVRREGWPYKETDALGQRVANKGQLVVYLFVHWGEARKQAALWAQTGLFIGGVYLFLTNTSVRRMRA